MMEDETVGWHHQLNLYEFGQVPGVGDGQGSLACCSPWGRKELDTTQKLNNSVDEIRDIMVSEVSQSQKAHV